MLAFTGTVVFKQIGCADGAGQDFARLETPTGIVDFHPAFNTSSVVMPLGQAVTCSVDTGSIGVVWELTFSNLTIQSIVSGVTYDDTVASSGANSVVFHLPHGTVTGWVVGNKLNCGVKRV